jgi:hypothetical protein
MPVHARTLEHVATAAGKSSERAGRFRLLREAFEVTFEQDQQLCRGTG